ncbi:MAG: DUF1659 domain-containing protein [Intestinibacter bartlettii]
MKKKGGYFYGSCSYKNLSSLKLYLNKGLDENSKQITGTKTFNYVDSEATDQNVLDVANALGNLQKHDVYNIVRIDNSTLSE